MIDLEANVNKAGDTIIHTVLRRSLAGLTLTIHAHPKIEEFMKSMGSGEEVDMRVISRVWEAVNKDKPLVFYHLNSEMIPSRIGRFTLDRPGQELEIYAKYKPSTRPQLNEDGFPTAPAYSSPEVNMINLSFLRLKGISSEEGVTFRYNQVYTPDGLIKLRDRIVEGQDEFHKTFLKPITLSVQMVSQDF